MVTMRSESSRVFKDSSASDLDPSLRKPSRERSMTAFVSKNVLTGELQGLHSTKAGVQCRICIFANSTKQLLLWFAKTVVTTSSESGFRVFRSEESIRRGPTTEIPDAISCRATSNAITPLTDQSRREKSQHTSTVISRQVTHLSPYSLRSATACF